MYMKLKRFLSMLLASVLCVGVLSGCGSSNQDNTPVVMTVDGEDVHSSELAAYIVYNMMYYQSYFGMDISQMATPTIFDSIKDGCKTQVVQYRALKKLAEQEGVSLSKESKETLEENKKTNRESMGSETGTFTRWLKYTVKGDEDPFVTYLNSYGYTEELYDDNSETMQLQEDIANKYYDDGLITEQFNETYLHAKSILIADTDDEGNVLTGDELEAAKKKAQEVLDQVKANPDDFDTIWEENNADTAQSDDGYYFTEGDMVDVYYNAVKEMDVNTVSDELVYYEGYGWFIIQKRELDEAALTDTSKYLNNYGDGDESTIMTAIGESIISEKLNALMEEMTVETNEEYDKITAYNVNTYLPFASDALVSGSGSGSAA